MRPLSVGRDNRMERETQMGRKGLLAGVALAFGLVSVAHAVPVPVAKRVATPAKAKRVAIVSELEGATEPLRAGTLGSFTPSIVDPSRSPILTNAQTSERSFRFTPSGKTGDRKALTLGVTSRVVAQADAARGSTLSALAATPTGYNVGLSVGYLGFSLTGGYSRLESGFGPSREGVDLGVSYRGNRWKASLQASGEVPTRLSLDPLASERRYGLELGGAYALTSRLSLNGGMRYQLITPLDPTLRSTDERGDPAVFLGTAFSF